MDIKPIFTRIPSAETTEPEIANNEPELTAGITQTADSIEPASQNLFAEFQSTVEGGASNFLKLSDTEFHAASLIQQAAQVNYAPTQNSWDDVENRLQLLKYQLQGNTSPQAADLLRQIQDLENSIRDARSNPFAFMPDQSILNRLQVLQNGVQSLLETPQPSSTPPDTGGAQANAAGAQPNAGGVQTMPVMLPPAGTWSDVENHLQMLRYELQGNTSPQAADLLQQIQQLENSVRDLRSNPFAFLPDQTTLNRLQALEASVRNLLMSQQAPVQATSAADPNATDPTGAATSTDPNTPAATDPNAPNDPNAPAATDPTDPNAV